VCPEGGGGNGSDDEWNFFTEKFDELIVLCPFHLVDSEITDGLFIKKSKDKKKNTNNQYDFYHITKGHL
jgi:hypothetical protein